jgi:hypothetical protein
MLEDKYCRKKPDVAALEARRIWAERDVMKTQNVLPMSNKTEQEDKSPLIEKEKWIAGYA